MQILAHELMHAVDDCQHGHKRQFAALCRSFGFEGKPTQMVPPEAVAKGWADWMVGNVGAFPHRKLDKAKSGQKQQTNRQLKAECHDCGAIWRMSAKHMINVTMCPCCGSDRLDNEAGDAEEDGE
jgi:rRNA maturation endonuclease Nob1